MALEHPQRGKKLTPQEQFEKLPLKRCPFHPNGKHSAKECRNLKQAVSDFFPDNKKKKDDEGEEDKEDSEKEKDYQDADWVVEVIFGGNLDACPDELKS